MKSFFIISTLLSLMAFASCQNRVGSRLPIDDNDPSLTTREPGRPTNAPIIFSNRRPPPFQTRFDDKDSYMVKKNLVFDQTVSDNMERFSLELFLKTMLSHKLLSQSNFMISPFSIYHMLTMITEGAGGSTLDELKRKLNISDISKTRDFQQYLNFYLSKSNTDSLVKRFALFVGDKNRPFNNEYEDIVEKIYGAIVESVEFQKTDETVQKVNGIVSNRTAGQITDAITKDDLLKAQLIMITGLHFKGEWKQKFNVTDTKQEKFFDADGNHIGYVDMMFQRNPIAFNAIAELGCYALEMEYADPPSLSQRIDFQPGLSMIILLPKKGQSLEETAKKIYSYSLVKLYRELYVAKVEYADDEVEVFLPKFDIDTDLDLQNVIKLWGVKEIFDQSNANLTTINPNYYISAMIHKSKISVDETGTIASATTTSIFTNKSTPSKFMANKPFIYFIVDKYANLVLFAGQFSRPTYDVNGQYKEQ